MSTRDQGVASDLDELTVSIREFADERDWAKFHDPKSLVLALVGEVGELAELFQWIPADMAATEFSKGLKRQRASEEIADVLTYLLRLTDVLGIDIVDATYSKLDDSKNRFNIDDFRGRAPDKSRSTSTSEL